MSEKGEAAAAKSRPTGTELLDDWDVLQAGAARVLTGQYVFRLSGPSAEREVTQNYTAVMVQEAGFWRVAALHVLLAP